MGYLLYIVLNGSSILIVKKMFRVVPEMGYPQVSMVVSILSHGLMTCMM